jgi:MFS family permease
MCFLKQAEKCIVHTPVTTNTDPIEKQMALSKVSMAANIVSTLFLRIASRTSFVLLSFYLGEHFTSATVVVLILETFYITELLLAPIVGSLSDRFGRKPFLLAAPILGCVAALCFLIGTWVLPHPNVSTAHLRLLLLLVLLLLGRLLEGATTALNTPASLGYITDTTVGSEKLRARMMTAFEVATVGGLAVAIPWAGEVSMLMGTWGFLVVIALHIINSGIILFLVKDSQYRVVRQRGRSSLFESVALLKHKRIFTFLPAWLAINTLVGAWTTLIIIMLTYPDPAADLRHPGQLLYGGFARNTATLLVGAFALLFLLGMGLWTVVLPRLRRTSVMLIALFGLTICVIVLTIINSLADDPTALSVGAHTTILTLLPVLVLGIVLLSGFSPAALMQMAAISELLPGKRGSVMGLYSVVLGIGQLLGAVIGGMSVDANGFYGLMIFSSALGFLSLASVVYMRYYKDDLTKAT